RQYCALHPRVRLARRPRQAQDHVGQRDQAVQPGRVRLMAKIVLGIGTSHGPMLVTPPKKWAGRLAFDKSIQHAWRGGRWNYDQLIAERAGMDFAAQITPDAMARNEARSQAGLDLLAEIFAEARIDVAVIIGNDQMEIFDERL